MSLNIIFTAAITIVILSTLSPTNAQIAAAPSLSPSSAPAPAPAPPFVNLANLLSVAGPFNTFLNYITQTKVIQTFQNQANDTKQGLTLFVPKDSAFSSLNQSTLSNLTSDQLKSLLLFHAFPKYYSLSDFKTLTATPINTFAGGSYPLNLTDVAGLIKVHSDWTNPKISSSVYSTFPVAVYELDQVLLPQSIFSTTPLVALAPAPAPDISPASDLAPSLSGLSPKSSESVNNESSASAICINLLNYFIFAVAGGFMLML
ncbi:fasciclin-like arabinogalactan protein 7 [Dioscorea cayenensis subsp. rotundata]|uniref:Fasciclin-like arabinogalactan protein 7 n=1 Tax=Dioscorea cayennensis subsp. rotundata TaxID=55577 RepID=A0AB40CVY1_DIOCR|nr:fasciclin-like arabinogalactan protein 7 [Dioscorea cayenensis subsp. rotundata]